MSSLNITYDEIRRRIGRYGAVGTSGWDTETEQDIEDAMRDGLRMFYFPTAEGGLRHGWSFLRPIYEFDLVAGQNSYQMPSGFGGMASDGIAFSSGEKQRRIARTPLVDVLSYLSMDSAQAAPKHYAVSAMQQGPGFATPYKLFLYPTPDKAYTVQLWYLKEPDEVDVDNTEPMGGAIHSQTILHACFYAWDCIMSKEQPAILQASQAKFEALLSASIAVDKEMAP